MEASWREGTICHPNPCCIVTIPLLLLSPARRETRRRSVGTVFIRCLNCLLCISSLLDLGAEWPKFADECQADRRISISKHRRTSWESAYSIHHCEAQRPVVVSRSSLAESFNDMWSIWYVIDTCLPLARFKTTYWSCESIDRKWRERRPNSTRVELRLFGLRPKSSWLSSLSRPRPSNTSRKGHECSQMARMLIEVISSTMVFGHVALAVGIHRNAASGWATAVATDGSNAQPETNISSGWDKEIPTSRLSFFGQHGSNVISTEGNQWCVDSVADEVSEWKAASSIQMFIAHLLYIDPILARKMCDGVKTVEQLKPFLDLNDRTLRPAKNIESHW